MDFGERLARCRTAAKLSQETVAARMGKKRQGNLSTMENRIHPPPATMVVRLAKAIGCAPADLLKEVETNYDRIRAGKPIIKESLRRKKAPPGKHRPASNE